jgi:hypothetical protein
VEIRYLGFEQRQNSRVYQFDVRIDKHLTRQVLVSADLAVFRDHGVALQEGPSLCGNKLTADLERGWEGEHELTAADLLAYTNARALADAQRASARKTPRNRPGVQPDAQRKSPWRNFGL